MNKFDLRQKRKKRVTLKLKKLSVKPRLTVFRSNKYVYAQIIDDNTGKTVAHESSLKIELKGKEAAAKVGEMIAKSALKKKVSEVVFDRSGYKYHGVVKQLADSARESGLKF